MLPIQKKLQLLLLGLACSIVTAFAVELALAYWTAANDLSKTANYFFYKYFFRPRLRPPANFVVIDRDDPTGEQSRADYADMIRRLHEAGAKCIALDILFEARRPFEARSDSALVASVAAAPEVILALDLLSVESPENLSTIYLEKLALPPDLCQTLKDEFVEFPAQGVRMQFDSLLAATRRIGHVNNLSAEYYHLPPFMTFRQKCFPALPIAIAQLCLETEGRRFSWTDLYEEAVDEDGQLLINLIPAREFTPLSWAEAEARLQSQPAEFRGDVVLIVNSSAERPVETIIDRNYPRWALLASATCQFLRGQNLSHSIVLGPALFNAGLVFLAVFWLLVILPRLPKRWRKTRLIFIAGTAFGLLSIFLLLHFGRVWIGAVVPGVAFNISLFVVRWKYYRMRIEPERRYANFGVAILEKQVLDEQEQPTNGVYPLQVFESASGEEQGNLSFPSFLGDEALQAALGRLRNLQASRDDLEMVGKTLFKAFGQDKIFQLLKKDLERAEDEDKNLRLKLRIDDADLVGLPWELMYSDDLTPGFIALQKRLSLTRYLPLDQPIPKRQFRIPLKILVVMASPTDLPLLDMKSEERLIKKSLLPFIWTGDIRLRFCRNATREKLAAELKLNPHVVHYIGHGEFDAKTRRAFLTLESEMHESDQVDADALAIMLQESSVNLIVLNSCETAAAASSNMFNGIAQSLVKLGIPAVVAMQYKILDDAALWFSQVFYPELFRSNSIDAAVAEARHHIVLKAKAGLNQQDWAAPVLFMRAKDGKVFETES